MRFKELRLSEPIVRAVAAQGYKTPTPIQIKAIPVVLAGKDVLGCAQTGTGKTGAFALPILERLSATPPRAHRTLRRRGRSAPSPAGGPRALVLCPTRELAAQIHESFRTYGSHLPLRHAAVFGGVSQVPQVRALRAGVDVLIATPGRLLDLIGQGAVDLRSIEVLVLDEADRMLDMGFINDIRRLIELVPQQRQTLLFSATMPAEIRRLANSILHDPVFVQAATLSTTADAVSQAAYMVDRKNKPVLLQRLLDDGTMQRTLIFTRTKRGADKLVKSLRRSGIQAGAIHGNKSQGARTRALDGFRNGCVPVLVATDIASRGIDVEQITHVVNFDIPNIPETYVHRVGRTARAGASGRAVSLCDHEELGDLRAIERLIGQRLQIMDDQPDIGLAAPVARTEHDPSTPRRQRRGVGTGRPASSRGGRGRRPRRRRSAISAN